MTLSASDHRPVWTADRLRERPSTSLISPASVGAGWLPVEQSWNKAGSAPDFHRGWARVRWDETALYYDTVFVGAGSNHARQLNERTWESGDVGEIFLRSAHASNYLEIHCTPENVRLQLLWPTDGLTRLRAKTASSKLS